MVYVGYEAVPCIRCFQVSLIRNHGSQIIAHVQDTLVSGEEVDVLGPVLLASELVVLVLVLLLSDCSTNLLIKEVHAGGKETAFIYQYLPTRI